MEVSLAETGVLYYLALGTKGFLVPALRGDGGVRLARLVEFLLLLVTFLVGLVRVVAAAPRAAPGRRREAAPAVGRRRGRGERGERGRRVIGHRLRGNQTSRGVVERERHFWRKSDPAIGHGAGRRALAFCCRRKCFCACDRTCGSVRVAR